MELHKKPLPKSFVSWQDYQLLNEQPNTKAAPVAEALLVEPDVESDSLLSVAAEFDEIQVSFPSFADGRGFSLARLLRRNGYRGVIRAVGDVAVDRVAYMQRVGFDCVQLSNDAEHALVAKKLAEVSIAYQVSSDGRGPVYVK